MLIGISAGTCSSQIDNMIFAQFCHLEGKKNYFKTGSLASLSIGV